MNQNQYVSIGITNILKELAFSNNLSVDRFPHKSMLNTDARMTVSEFESCIRWLIEQSNKPYLGLEFGALNLTQYGILGPLAGSAESIYEAFDIGKEFHMLLHPLIRLEAIQDGKDVIARYSVEGSLPSSPFYGEACMSGFFSWYRYFVGKPLGPSADYIAFRHDAPAHKEKYQSHFQCDILFNQPFDEVKIKNPDLTAPLQSSSPSFHAKLKQQAKENRGKIESFSEEIKRIIKSSPSCDISLPEVAKQLHCSERQLQRKLKEEHSSFNVLKQEIRKQEAIRLLEESHLNVEQIAFRLGYEQRSSFAAAFQHWTGENPTNWRNKTKNNKS